MIDTDLGHDFGWAFERMITTEKKVRRLSWGDKSFCIYAFGNDLFKEIDGMRFPLRCIGRAEIMAEDWVLFQEPSEQPVL